jgi:glycosyltransferase involved in cell wall biosynthesis
VGRLAARFARVPVVIHTVHGFAFHEASSGPALLMYALLEQLAAHFCDALVTVSQFHCDWAARLHIGNARTRTAIPNGIDPARLAPSRDRAPTRAALGIADGELMCLTTGRVVRQKGLDILLHALARYDGPPLRVVLAGEGEELAPLKLMARDLHLGARVMFLGFRTDLGDLLAAADLVVLPSLREGLSISLLEAMAAGKAIIATDIGSNLEVTRHGEAARIVPVGNAAELTGAMMSLAGDAGLRDRLGRAALAEFQRTYHEQMMLDRYMELYARLTGEKCGEVRA